MRYAILFAAAAIAFGQRPGTVDPAASPGGQLSPITGRERLEWVVKSTVGPVSLTGGLFTAGWGTLFNEPREYGPHWDGFGQRYGMRLTGIATSNVMEAGLGSFWGEDPRYVRSTGETLKGRLGHVVKMTFMAQNRQGHLRPAYARYIAIPGNNFLSNTWRADSGATVSRASLRTALGFLGRFAGNAFDEFWPDVQRRFFNKGDQPDPKAPGGI